MITKVEFINVNRSIVTMVVLGLALAFNACKKEEPIGPVPILTAGIAANGFVGTTVKITASINAPEGLKTLVVLKDGQVFDRKLYNNAEKSDSYSKDYVIENLPASTSVVFTLQATDLRNQSSTIATQLVTVSAVPTKQVEEIRGVLSGKITWTKDKIYKLIGFVRVGGDTLSDTPSNVATGVLTIEPGTVIIGDRASKGTLIIQRGSRIVANGTAESPIVFTSERPVGQREPGDWGGLVICGKAVNNQGTGVQLEGSFKGFHGDTNDADNSGSLKYVRVEFAGIPLNPSTELSSFTFGSVGSGTTIEFLQASYGLGDSFGWFGGTFNAKYLIAYHGLDDDLDLDLGYRGNLQFMVGIRGAALADQSGSNGFEIDNDAQSTSNIPFTAATISNATLIGAKATAETVISVQFQNGMHLRRNCKVKIYNSAVTAYPNGVLIEGNNTLANAANGSLVLNRIWVMGVKGWGANGFGLATSGTQSVPYGFPVRDFSTHTTPVALNNIGSQKPSAWFAAQTGNKVMDSYDGSGLSASLFATGTPTFTLSNGGLLATGGLVPAGAFWSPATFIGAFGSEDWTATWSNFSPGTTNYNI